MKAPVYKHKTQIKYQKTNSTEDATYESTPLKIKSEKHVIFNTISTETGDKWNDDDEVKYFYELIFENNFLAICDKLVSIVEENKDIDPSYLEEQNESVFYSHIIPKINLKDYLKRLLFNANINASTIVLIAIYIDRFCSIYEFHLTMNNIYRVILTALYVAVKYNEDSVYSISIYSQLGGISSFELQRLEYSFLEKIDYSLYVEEEFYTKCEAYFLNQLNLE